MIITLNDYRKKVLGCWMGKNIGGTLGAPMEWKRQVNNVTFYTQELNGNPLPNDDLDLQLVWLIALEEKGIDIDSKILGEYWLSYITPHWAEYGNGKINMRSGLIPPLSGSLNNLHKDSCGAFIRSEIWACIAPGSPEIAARYAFEDAIVDHGNGEGTYAEVFCAAMESAAFVESNPFKLIDIGLSYIPKDCGVAKVINLVIERYKLGTPYMEVRDEILSKFRAHFVGYAGISQEDANKGFSDGPLGWDVPANIGFMVIGLLYGEGDFDKSLCYTVNCGEDTDCTAATIGSIYGIIHGIDAIPQKWIDPIGRSIKTMCLNLGELNGRLPSDIDELTARVEKVARQVVLRHCPSVELSEIKSTDLSDLDKSKLYSESHGSFIYKAINGPIYKFYSYDVYLEYVGGPYIKENIPKQIMLRIENKSYFQENINIKWYTDEKWHISPSNMAKVFIGTWHGSEKELIFELSTETLTKPVNRFVIELTVDGRHSVMLIPVVLLEGNFIDI